MVTLKKYIDNIVCMKYKGDSFILSVEANKDNSLPKDLSPLVTCISVFYSVWENVQQCKYIVRIMSIGKFNIKSKRLRELSIRFGNVKTVNNTTYLDNTKVCDYAVVPSSLMHLDLYSNYVYQARHGVYSIDTSENEKIRQLKSKESKLYISTSCKSLSKIVYFPRSSLGLKNCKLKENIWTPTLILCGLFTKNIYNLCHSIRLTDI